MKVTFTRTPNCYKVGLLSRPLVPFEVSCQPDRVQVQETMWQLEAPLIPNYSCHKWLVFQKVG